jgi:hypothetical protein|tara:strand:- start:257 stop:1168 length:912 start_codon:yes stop_codon:yes gene_type:complete
MGAELKVDTISEKTSSNGVVIDLVTIKDGIVNASGINLGSAALVESELEILDGANITTTELNIIDGDTSATATTVVDADRVVFNDNGTMKQVAVTDLSAYFDDEITAMPNLITTAATTVGALNSGSITSGFGTIDTGSSAITTTGTVTYGTLNDGTTSLTSSIAELNYSDLATLGTTAASKIFTADANNLTAISGAVVLTEDTLTFDSTQDWDVRSSPVAKVTLTNNVTFDAPTNPTTGQYISIVCIQDGTGSRTIAWNAIFEFKDDTAPTATTTANKGDMFTFRYNGSKWLEVGRNLNLTLS